MTFLGGPPVSPLCDVHIALTLSLASGFATPRLDDLIQYKNKYKYGT